jgi:acetate kinase
MSILAINAGSSSIKFACYGAEEPAERWLHGSVDRIGQSEAHLTFDNGRSNQEGQIKIEGTPAGFLIDWLEEHVGLAAIHAIGHRVVHGLRYSEPMLVTEELLTELRRIIPLDPSHLPQEIELLDAFRKRAPQLRQVACFDTAFHSAMPRAASLLPIPRRFEAQGMRRYGFHGLSYAYLMEELNRLAGTDAARGRVILAHLGNGASLAAVRGGKSIDTSMGFTPAGGLPMGTRPGDLDPGVAEYLMSAGNLTPEEFRHLIHHESGLFGLSETSADMRDLLESQAHDVRAAEAVELFCYQTRKWIGSFAAALEGLDTLVFSGGIGENAAEVRRRVCNGLQFLGIDLDEPSNAANHPLISAERSRVTVRVIPTDEEKMIVRHVRRLVEGVV